MMATINTKVSVIIRKAVNVLHILYKQLIHYCSWGMHYCNTLITITVDNNDNELTTCVSVIHVHVCDCTVWQ